MSISSVRFGNIHTVPAIDARNTSPLAAFLTALDGKEAGPADIWLAPDGRYVVFTGDDANRSNRNKRLHAPYGSEQLMGYDFDVPSKNVGRQLDLLEE